MKASAHAREMTIETIPANSGGVCAIDVKTCRVAVNYWWKRPLWVKVVS